jgi:hypothetical protein
MNVNPVQQCVKNLETMGVPKIEINAMLSLIEASFSEMILGKKITKTADISSVKQYDRQVQKAMDVFLDKRSFLENKGFPIVKPKTYTEVWDSKRIGRVLGYGPDSGTIRAALFRLCEDGWLSRAKVKIGDSPSRYAYWFRM